MLIKTGSRLTQLLSLSRALAITLALAHRISRASVDCSRASNSICDAGLMPCVGVYIHGCVFILCFRCSVRDGVRLFWYFLEGIVIEGVDEYCLVWR